MSRRSLILLLAILAVGVVSGQWVEDSIYVGCTYVYRVEYNAKGGELYGCSEYCDSVFVINCSTNQVVAWVEGVVGPRTVVYDSIDDKAFCVFGYGDSLLVIDGATHTRKKALSIPGQTGLLAWSASYNRLYSLLGDDRSIAVFDCSADTELCRIGIGQDAGPLLLNDRQGKLYVHDNEAARLSIIDLASNSVTETIQLGIYVVMGRDYCDVTDRYYFCGDGCIYAIDGVGDSLVDFIDPSENAWDVEILPEDSVILVGTSTNQRPDTVFVLDMYSGEVVRRLVVGNAPKYLHRSPATGLTYCVNASTDDISVIAADGSSVLTTLPVGSTPHSVTFAPKYCRAYVGHSSRHVYVLRDTIGRPGIAEGESKRRLAGTGAPICRGMLEVPGRVEASLLDITGRRVMDLKPGENGIRHLAPGVYFVREEGPRGQGSEGSSVRKVVIQK